MHPIGRGIASIGNNRSKSDITFAANGVAVIAGTVSTINTQREKMLRIRSVVANGTMLDRYDFSDEQRAELSEFVEENTARFREVSLRLVIKLADLMKSFGNSWKEMARVTCMV